MKTQFNISTSETGGEGCNGISITIQTEDYHRNSTMIYNKVLAALTKELEHMEGFKDMDGNYLGKVELEIRDYSEREYPNGTPRIINLQDKTVRELDNKA